MDVLWMDQLLFHKDKSKPKVGLEFIDSSMILVSPDWPLANEANLD